DPYRPGQDRRPQEQAAPRERAVPVAGRTSAPAGSVASGPTPAEEQLEDDDRAHRADDPEWQRDELQLLVVDALDLADVGDHEEHRGGVADGDADEGAQQ